MQREILFRGKSKRTGEWFFGNLFGKDNSGRTHVCTTSQGCLDIDPETVGQFTGITDNNGTKIFEGDILKEQYGAYERIYDVFWKEDYFAFCAKYKDDSYYLDEIDPSRCKVMGNIYDNPELL